MPGSSRKDVVQRAASGKMTVSHNYVPICEAKDSTNERLGLKKSKQQSNNSRMDSKLVQAPGDNVTEVEGTIIDGLHSTRHSL